MLATTSPRPINHMSEGCLACSECDNGKRHWLKGMTICSSLPPLPGFLFRVPLRLYLTRTLFPTAKFLVSKDIIGFVFIKMTFQC